MRHRIGIVAAALSDDPRQAAPAARAAGFTGAQFHVARPGLDLTGLSQTGRREFRHVLSSNALELTSLRFDLGPRGLGPGADVDAVLRRFDRALEAAAGLQAPLLCVDLGPLPPPEGPKPPTPAVTPEMAGLILLPPTGSRAVAPAPVPSRTPADDALEAQVDAALADLGARADRYGVTVALRSDLASMAALERAIARSRCPWFGVDLDPVAILRDAWEQDEVFSRLGALFRHARGRDAVRGADRRTMPAVIGQGSIDWERLLSDLDAAGYAGWITIDPIELTDRPGGAVAGLQHLRAVAAR